MESIQRRVVSAYLRMVECGQGYTEYALILATIAIAAIVALQALGTNISTALNDVAGKVRKQQRPRCQGGSQSLGRVEH